MSTYEPGTVALLPFAGREVRAMWSERLGWMTAEGHTNTEYVNARPLLVLDPENVEQMEALAEALRQNGVEAGGIIVGNYHNLTTQEAFARALVDKTTNAVHSLLAPPKPEEPMGDGAVVEDRIGLRWVRVAGTSVDSPPWRHRGRSGRFWDHVNAVRVLSEGVTA